MSGTRIGILGFESFRAQSAAAVIDVLGDGDPPGTLGMDDFPDLVQRQQKRDTDTVMLDPSVT